MPSALRERVTARELAGRVPLEEVYAFYTSTVCHELGHLLTLGHPEAQGET